MSLGTTLGSPGFNPVADVDGNGAVNAEDYKIVLDGAPDADIDGDGVLDSIDTCLNSNVTTSLKVNNCETGVANQILPNGCTFSDLLTKCSLEIRNYGNYMRCVANRTNEWKTHGLISGKDKGAIQSCAARSKLH